MHYSLTTGDGTIGARNSMKLFAYPNPVNEVSARLVAGGVVLMCLAAMLLDVRWLTLAIAYGFVARVLAGPTLSPLAQVVRVLTPRLGLRPRLVPGPPKRFAQAMGAVFSIAAVALIFGGWQTAGYVLLGLLAVAAALEAFLAVCLGCLVFAWLIRAGLIPEAVCEACNDFRGAGRAK